MAAAYSTPTLLGIQQELFICIAELLGPQDLLLFRLVCKCANNKIFDIYVKKHFTERAFLIYSEESLDTLLAISKHGIFGKTMETVILDVAQFNDDRSNYYHEKPDDTDFESLVLWQQENEHQEALLKKQRSFQESDSDVKLLIRIFKCFALSAGLEEVQIKERCPFSREAKTLTALCGRFVAANVFNRRRLVDIVMQALAESHLQAHKLTVSIFEDSWDWYDLTFPTTLPNARKISQHLRQLKVKPGEMDFQNGSDENAVELLRLIQSAPCSKNYR